MMVRHELLLDVGTKVLAVDRFVEDARRGKLVAAQRAEEGQGAPMAVRRQCAQAPALPAPAAQWSHVGLDLDKDEPGGIEIGLPRPPAPAPPGDIGAGLFKREQRFFEP